MNVLAVLISLAALGGLPDESHIAAKLYAAHGSVQPGGQTSLAVEIKIEKGWHIYHPVVLDTGMPTVIAFEAPEGVTFGELHFPIPKLGKQAGMEYLAFEDRIVVLTTMKVAEGFAADAIELKATIDALACKELCMPARTGATLTVAVSAREPQPTHERLFEEARAALPKSFAASPFITGSSVKLSGEQLTLDGSIELVAGIRVKRDHHIQDRDPGNEHLIASRLFIEPLNGLKIGDQQWPKPHEREIEYVGKVREQSGAFDIRVPLSIGDTKFLSGPIVLRVLFTYQSCDDRGMCFPSEWAEEIIRFTAATPNAARQAVGGTVYPQGATGVFAAQRPVAGAGAPGTGYADAALDAIRGFDVPKLTPEDWAEEIPWVQWKPGLAEYLSSKGHLVYVDYTASWCLTCQANKKTVLETDKVRAKMAELGVIPIEADFTNRDPAMAKALKRFAPTVPVNLIYPPNRTGLIAKLPVVLTQYHVIRALEHPEEYAVDGGSKNLVLVMLAGFLGGLILNVMPCVLPVISIKILSFVQQAHEDPARVLRLGLAFCAGIMAWFWMFAVLLSFGEIPWQYPSVVVGLSAVIFVFSLNLFGVFEITLPGAAAGTLDGLASREGYTGAFMKGLLATLLGTACTAPFLIGATAYALTQPWWIVWLVFSSAGVGMSAPYLVLSAKPGWMKFIPRPGNWMITFKQATGFVLLGTVVWLLWILADQLDAKGVVWTVGFLAFLGLAVWMLGKAKPNWSARRRASIWTASIAVAAIGLWFCLFYMYGWPRRATKIADYTVTTQLPGPQDAQATRS